MRQRRVPDPGRPRQRPADLLITNVRLANVFTGEVHPADVAIANGRIAAVEGAGDVAPGAARETLDGDSQIAAPGLVDSHLHIESSLLTPAPSPRPSCAAARRQSPKIRTKSPTRWGCRACALSGKRQPGLPLHIYYLASTCVPAAAGLETCQGQMGPAEIAEMLSWDGVLGLAEVMDARAVIDESRA